MTRTNARQKNLLPGYFIRLHDNVNRKISISATLLEDPFLGRDGFWLLWTFGSHKKINLKIDSQVISISSLFL